MLYDIIIIGGGPAGITSGIYCARKKLKTLVLTKDFIGQVGKTGEIDNYPGLPGVHGMELSQKMKEHLLKFEVDVKEGEEVSRIEKDESSKSFVVHTTSGDEEHSFEGRAIIVATGRDPRPLEVEGEKEYIGRGVSYCTICDAPFFKDKKVVVIGGGNSGFEAALDLAPYASEIYIFERSNQIRADEILQEEVARHEKIKIFLEREVEEIKGDMTVKSIVYKDLKTGEVTEMPVEGVFIHIGSIPATGFLKGLVEFNEWDEVKVNIETCETSCPGIFAAGDVNAGRWKQIVIACGEGARAALSAYDWLQRQKK